MNVSARDETVHSDFETIKRETQEYRISTSVRYRIKYDDYKCKAILYRSSNGRIMDEKRDRLCVATGKTSDKQEVQSILEDCIQSCKEKMDEIEDAKDILVEVNISD